LTVLAFEIAKKLIAVVVVNSRVESIYGMFASGPVFLSWLYLVRVLILNGPIFVRPLSPPVMLGVQMDSSPAG